VRRGSNAHGARHASRTAFFRTDLYVHEMTLTGLGVGSVGPFVPSTKPLVSLFLRWGGKMLLHQDQSFCCRSPGEKACVDLVSWHADDMAGKEIDPIRAKSALAVIRQNPGIALFAVSPLIALVAIIWVFAGAGWGIAVALASLVAGGAFIVLKR
jgi:hypothetical protein